MNKQEINKLIDSIHINSANLEYISATGKINGTLRSELERVINEAIQSLTTEPQVDKVTAEEWWDNNKSEAMYWIGSCEVITKDEFLQAINCFANNAEAMREHAMTEPEFDEYSGDLISRLDRIKGHPSFIPEEEVWSVLKAMYLDLIGGFNEN